MKRASQLVFLLFPQFQGSWSPHLQTGLGALVENVLLLWRVLFNFPSV